MAPPSESDRTEQIISQFRQKTLHAILASRVPHLRAAAPGPSSSTKRDLWFHLALGDLLGPVEHNGGLMDPLVVDVLLVPPGGEADSSDGAAEDVIERWNIRCVAPSPWSVAPHQHQDGCFDRRTYKKSIILLRSIYSMLRLLPAHRVFRLLCSSSQPYNYDLSYRVPPFWTPFSRAEEAEFKKHSFMPVDTLLGQLVVSVQYRPSLANFRLAVAMRMPPIIIPDYVGSPVAEPIRPFPASLPDRVSRTITSPHPPRSIQATANPSLDRSRSWNCAPMVHHPLGSAPGRPVSELRSSLQEHYGRPVSNEQPCSENKRSQNRRNCNFDDKLSPPFSTSPSPSPPTHGCNSLQSRSRSDTAPVSIPTLATGKSQVHRTFSDPFKSLLPPPSPRSTRPDLSCQESHSKSKSFRSQGDIYQNSHTYAPYKGPKDGVDDSGRFSACSSGGSPRFFSRSPSKLSIHNDDYDGDFSYPFAVDDVETPNSHTSKSFDGKEGLDYASFHKSREAAVGSLIHMLRTASPLRQDQSCLHTTELDGQISSSSYALSRKISDAFKELQSYTKMKSLLLSKSEIDYLNP
ncbi:hypothetical protein Cni_G15757 [Canna indica]|uniref:Autophagy-related protein 13 N-terminal domain-containing protein n=1 Tax=Canna indica TaxID=4628 RepID=A0AAQ3KIF9_9LILI|nr:hypothetical protein Cni_G15757 [Canna indica]